MSGEARKKTTIAGWSAVLATWIGIIGAGWGGLRALATYDEEIKRTADATIVQTFALYDMFNSSQMLSVRQNVSVFLQQADELTNQESSTSPVETDTTPTSPEVTSPPNSQASSNDLFVYVDFFDAVHVCVERKLCDADLVDRLLKPYAIFSGLKPYIEEVREEESSLNKRHQFGSGIEWLDKTDLQALASIADE
jgi:hypothetical protein